MILSLNGNAKRGRDLFLNATGVQCRNCHQLGDQGRNVGPRLDDVGKRLARRQLLESILDPSAVIDEKFRTWIVQTADGRRPRGYWTADRADGSGGRAPRH